MITICHIITTLEIGGAQMMLCKLLEATDRQQFSHFVVCLGDEEPMAPRIRALGFPVHCLGLPRSSLAGGMGLVALVRLLRQKQPSVVQTWMHHADLLGGIAARAAGIRRVLWGIHHSNFDPAVTKTRTVLVARACGILSSFVPSKIVCCSEASRVSHAALRYDTRKMVVVPNGFDLTAFEPCPEARASVLQELELPADAVLIGLFARYHGMKDHRTFVSAASMLARRHRDPHFILCGKGVDWSNAQLRSWIEDEGIQDRCRLLGCREDMPRITAALDIATSCSSSGEAFSTTMGEAMSAGVACVTTDVGDSAAIVGDTGIVIASRDPSALCNAWWSLIERGQIYRRELGSKARARIQGQFSLPLMTAKYQGLYRSCSDAVIEQ
ncbi:MAG TPA: glycosyltransferase [Bryobacteraceae bacterium]|nr:glycosyltransferase [Bryobacteraceae bacterium]